jgi:hypothetical protein
LFKQLSEILQPDPTWGHIAVSEDGERTWRRLTLADHHRRVSALALGPNVPPELTDHFDRARNVLLYAWFAYRLLQVAELQALSSLELALKQRFAVSASSKGPGLRELLSRAHRENLIRGDSIREFARRAAMRQTYAANPLLAPHVSPPEEPDRYLEVLCQALPGLRNALAHGSGGFGPHAFVTVEVCSDIITQLFAQEPDGAREETGRATERARG